MLRTTDNITMQLIVCSTPESFPDEQVIVRELMNEGLTTFHLRKPSYTKEQVRKWLKELREEDQRNIVIHSHWSLVEEFPLKGIHFGTQALHQCITDGWEQMLKSIVNGKPLTISTSVHHQEEIDKLPEQIDYVWLSPIFESISKSGYSSSYSADQFDSWVKYLQQKKIKAYALGGVTDKNLLNILQRGFNGAVFLGYVWQGMNGLQDIQLVKKRFKQLTDTCKTDLTF
jgi:thiamine-phosphate pyrophosphorylase